MTNMSDASDLSIPQAKDPPGAEAEALPISSPPRRARNHRRALELAALVVSIPSTIAMVVLSVFLFQQAERLDAKEDQRQRMHEEWEERQSQVLYDAQTLPAVSLAFQGRPPSLHLTNDGLGPAKVVAMTFRYYSDGAWLEYNVPPQGAPLVEGEEEEALRALSQLFLRHDVMVAEGLANSFSDDPLPKGVSGGRSGATTYVLRNGFWVGAGKSIPIISVNATFAEDANLSAVDRYLDSLMRNPGLDVEVRLESASGRQCWDVSLSRATRSCSMANEANTEVFGD